MRARQLVYVVVFWLRYHLWGHSAVQSETAAGSLLTVLIKEFNYKSLLSSGQFVFFSGSPWFSRSIKLAAGSMTRLTPFLYRPVDSSQVLSSSSHDCSVGFITTHLCQNKSTTSLGWWSSTKRIYGLSKIFLIKCYFFPRTPLFLASSSLWKTITNQYISVFFVNIF